MILSDSQLQQIMSLMPDSLRMIYLPFLNRVMEIHQINTRLRASAFLAQIAHESGELRFMEEIWGPTPQQERYEPPGSLATRLGNTQPGDGFRFRGRGPIQITGRANYTKYGDLLGVDIVSNPDLATTPQIAFSIAGLFWRTNGLNELADVEDFVAITRRINGGLNGLQNRLKYYNRAKSVIRTSRSGSGSIAAYISDSPEADIEIPGNFLPRGQEAIEEVATMETTELEVIPPAEPAPKTKKSLTRRALIKKTARKLKAKAAKKAAKKTPKKPVKKTGKAAKKTAAKPTVKKTQKAAKKPARKASLKKTGKAKKKPVKATKKATNKRTSVKRKVKKG